MPEFDKVSELMKYVQKEIADSLEKDVVPEIKNIEREEIQKVVYDAYNNLGTVRIDPYEYQRRMDHGGLSDPNNMIEVVEIVGNEVILSVANKTKGQDNPSYYIAELVEYGDGYNGMEYDYKQNRDNTAYQYLNPRPFTAETVKRLESQGIHMQKLIDSLKGKGFVIDE